jgi:hypothetical protein
MLLIKDEVRPYSFYILAAVANASHDFKFDVTITAGEDGKHMTNSLHYVGRAIDVRSKNFPDNIMKYTFLNDVLSRLNKNGRKDYQGFIESIGTDNEHFHFEFDPKPAGIQNV